MSDLQERKVSKGQARRDALILAAAELFWHRGFDATSIAHVAAHADVPVGNVYYYFKTKADLAAGVAELFVQQTQALVAEVDSEASAPRDAVKLTIQRLKATQADRVRYGCPIASACYAFSRSAPEAGKMAAESFSILAGFFAQKLTAAGYRPSIALTRSRALLCEWQGGIALAHALHDSQLLAETFARMERIALQP
ncbi:MAG: TetR/AcrR family transcriptional regulator [Pseudomonadota bacterium]